MNTKHNYTLAIGLRKGIMTAVAIAGKVNGKIMLRGICDCGKWKTFGYYNFMRGCQLSCGCNQNHKRITHNYKHPLYDTWHKIRCRCTNPKDEAYPNYGGRGVKMCEEWGNSFQKFYDWCIENGWQRGLFVDKDIKGGGLLYSPETCTIVTRKVNNQTRRGVKITLRMAREIKSSRLPYKEIVNKYNISKQTVWDIRSGRTWKEGIIISLNDFLKDKPLY